MTHIEAPPSGLFLSPPDDPLAIQIDPAQLAAVRSYIDTNLPSLICYPDQVTNKLAIPLEHPFMVPSVEAQDGFSYGDQQFDWDSFFHARLLMIKDRETGMQPNSEYYKVVTGMLENAISMFDRFGIVPNSSLYIRLGHGQPPLRTSYIFEVYDTYKDVKPEIDLAWLSDKISMAKREYATVWMGTKDPHNRLVFEGLSRYYDPDLTDDHVQAESGHDYSPRFDGEAYDYLPADLNAMLYKYEMDFAREAGLRGNKPEMDFWLETAATRKATMYDLMYDKENGVYHDRNFRTGQWGPVNSLASYVAMWAGMVEPRSEQSHEMVRALKLFEHIGGLAVTEPYTKPVWERRKIQWGFPNAWSPPTIFTVDGLEICGHPEDARRIAMKSLAAKVLWHNMTGVVLEAYNAADPTRMPAPGMYPRQVGFGFTDAEIEYFSTKYVDGIPLPAALMRGAVLLNPN
ncbi:MAG TPA: trehalase family glycosidase [Patescibacteria group bacterium]|nr:trehalase family glycosidase [Patescibacteria group bacterium]